MRRDPFFRRLLLVCLVVLANSALPPSLARLSWLGSPILCALLMHGLARRPSWRSRWHRSAYLAIGVASMVAEIVWVFAPRRLLITGLPLLALFVLFICWSLMRLIRRLASATPTEEDLVAGGLAGYLLLGIQGGLLLTVIDALLPGSFRDTATGALVQLPPIGSVQAATSVWDMDVRRITYFAFVSLTTVGYGDITPIKPVAQLASVALSVLGPFYLAVVLGVVVSRYIGQGFPADPSA